MKWLARRLYLWASRLDNTEWHDLRLSKGEGEDLDVIIVSYYGDGVCTVSKDWDFECSCGPFEEV